MSNTSMTPERNELDFRSAWILLLVHPRRNFAGRQDRGGSFWPAFRLGGLLLAFATMEVAAETTIYVGKHFEVREHDAPVKYVFNANTRVARVTGSLSTNERIQRMRLRSGWNLVSLAVTAPNFLDQLREITGGPAPVLKAVYRWKPATKDYGLIASGESVPAGTVLWVSALSDAIVAVRGEYREPSQWGAPGGETFLAVPALEAQPLALPAGVTLWRYDAQNGRWQAGLAGDLASLSDLPPALAPGEAIYVHAPEPTDLGLPAPDERVRYYHQDHLGSSSVVTDAAGQLVEENAFYPFGGQRHEHRIGPFQEAYKFTQKERDRESGLDYVEARFLSSLRGRFLCADPKYADLEAGTPDPQQLNLYAYARNNPVLYADPAGLDVVPSVAESVDEIDVDTTAEAVTDFLGSTWLGGAIKAPPKVKDAASFSAGFGDAIVDPLAAMGGVQTFGMGYGHFVRMAFGINNVDESSQDYGGGGVISTAIQFAMGAGEIKAAISGLSRAGANTGTGIIRSGAGRTSAPIAVETTHEVSPRAFARTANGSPPAAPRVPTGARTGGSTTIDPVRAAESGAIANRNAILARHNGYIMANVQAYQSVHNTSVPIAIFEAFAKAADEIFGKTGHLLP